MSGIAAFGGYVPRLRLARSAIVAANQWVAPGLAAYAAGERAMCNWDEDAVTMAVAAARDCLPVDGEALRDVGAVHLASTTLPFADRQCAALVATALNLPPALETLDVTTSQRAATSALANALQRLTSRGKPILLLAAEHRRARAASPQEVLYGDGAAAVVLGPEAGAAQFVAAHSVQADFVDHYRGAGEPFDYAWEERWVRDEGLLKLIPDAVTRLLRQAQVPAASISHFMLPCLTAGVPQTIAKRLGIPEVAVRDGLHAVLGNTGAAHPLVMLVHALEQASPGARLLLIGFGQGVDALLFEATPRIASVRPRQGVGAALAAGRREANYHKYLAFNGLVAQDGGIRSEVDRQTALSVLHRNSAMLTAFVGGRCRTCGTRQYPKSHICVNPNCGALNSQDEQPFADTPAEVLTWSADWLTYTPDPPAQYGMVQFAGGGRVMADFTDVDPAQGIDVGSPMRMVFRLREIDHQRGFRKYFWKATPAS
jgi:3-hydroxy-3-methylglutaryl CoA synthase